MNNDPNGNENWWEIHEIVNFYDETINLDSPVKFLCYLTINSVLEKGSLHIEILGTSSEYEFGWDDWQWSEEEHQTTDFIQHQAYRGKEFQLLEDMEFIPGEEIRYFSVTLSH